MRLAGAGCLVFIVGCTGVDSDPKLTRALAEAGCDAPDGPLHAYSQATELEQLVLGRWIHCAGPTLIGHGEQGIELLADHSYYALVLDGTGTLQRKPGFDGQGTWHALQLSPTDVEFSYTGGEGRLALEDDPVRFALPVDTEDNRAIFARIE